MMKMNAHIPSSSWGIRLPTLQQRNVDERSTALAVSSLFWFLCSLFLSFFFKQFFLAIGWQTIHCLVLPFWGELYVNGIILNILFRDLLLSALFFWDSSTLMFITVVHVFALLWSIALYGSPQFIFPFSKSVSLLIFGKLWIPNSAN